MLNERDILDLFDEIERFVLLFFDRRVKSLAYLLIISFLVFLCAENYLLIGLFVARDRAPTDADPERRLDFLVL